MRPRFTAAVTGVLAVTTVGCCGAFVVGMVVGDVGPAIAAFHAITGYWALGAPALAAICAGARRWRLAGVALVLTAVWLGWVVPGTVAFGPDPDGTLLRLVSANVLMVNPEPDALVAELFQGEPDLVVLQEYSPPFVAAADPYRASYPHVVERPAEHSFGMAVFSRLPLLEVLEVDAGAPVLSVVVEVGGRRVRILVVHTLPPISASQVVDWRAELQWLEAWATTMDPDEALVVAGDLNATRYHPSFRRLLRGGGLRDAHAEVGRATAATWPNRRFPFPPLQLDHLLLRGEVRAASISEGTGSGSDHRPILAELRVGTADP